MAICATDARFRPTLPKPNRDIVEIAGEALKIHCAPGDVETFGEDDGGNSTAIAPSLSIIDSNNASLCVARVAHKANFAKTYVRIRCARGEMSGWLLVAGRD
jgi:hypothetical protein